MTQQPAPEWESFGASCFALPLVELVEAADGCVLATTLAWDGAAGNAGGAATRGVGSASPDQAAARALEALASLKPPAPLSASAMQLERSDPPPAGGHLPDERTWHAAMGQVLAELEQSAAGSSGAQVGGNQDDPSLDLARQEYLTNGQQGLDGLLAAMNSEPQLGPAGSWDEYDGSSGLEPGASGRDDYAGALAEAGAGGPGSGGSPAGMSKLVMARRTEVALRGDLDPAGLLEALQVCVWGGVEGWVGGGGPCASEFGNTQHRPGSRSMVALVDCSRPPPPSHSQLPRRGAGARPTCLPGAAHYGCRRHVRGVHARAAVRAQRPARGERSGRRHARARAPG